MRQCQHPGGVDKKPGTGFLEVNTGASLLIIFGTKVAEGTEWWCGG
jgi:hypothetical protein